MAKRFYEPVAGDLTLWKDPHTYVKADLEAEVPVVEELQALSDEARARVAGRTGQTLESYDAQLEAERTRLKDLIDFFDYDNTMLNLNVKDGDWFTPVSVESVCGEEASHGADLTIDGATNTYWQHNTDHEHDIVWQLRDYKKRISKLQVRVGSSSRNLLTDLDIYVADTIGGLTAPGNLAAAGVALVVPNSWEEIPFSSKQNGKWVRFAGFGSQQPSNEVRIQEIEMRVVTVEYD